MLDRDSFRAFIQSGIPSSLPELRPLDPSLNHAPKRHIQLSAEEQALAVENALRYFPATQQELLRAEFGKELDTYGHIYMYRLRPPFPLSARPIDDFPARSKQAAAIMLMICNNLDPAVAQHPDELITYGGNGAVFQNWAQFRLTMQLLSELRDDETLAIFSGHPHSVFPTSPDAPRVVLTNGLLAAEEANIEKLYALGVSQYGQMTAGSFMYIGPQGIVHGTTLTIRNAGRLKGHSELRGKLFVSSGLGGMSGAQAKAGTIAGAISVIAEVNPLALKKRHAQGWVNETFTSLPDLTRRIREAQKTGSAISLGYLGNIVALWEYLAQEDIRVDIGSDQTSLHNPYGGGYYPIDASFEEANKLIVNDPEHFRALVHTSLRRHVDAINTHTARGMYFFDYGNAFLVEARKAQANILQPDGRFRYPSYVEDIMGPLFFDFGFGPFRWVCTSCDPKDLETCDQIAGDVIAKRLTAAPQEIQQQLQDNLDWVRSARGNTLVVGSQARILYADGEGRVAIALALNDAIHAKRISAPVVLGRDHHDVSGTDSPYRETANIRDGSQWTADMAVHTFVGNSMRGATWTSLHNGGGVGPGKSINGGFGLVLDGSKDAARRAEQMLTWDVFCGVGRRAWAKNPGAVWTIEQLHARRKDLRITMAAR